MFEETVKGKIRLGLATSRRALFKLEPADLEKIDTANRN
jgi:hypothetical protein